VKIKFTPPALADVDQILEFLQTESAEAADRLQSRLRAVIDGLSEFPRSGRRTNLRHVRYANTHPYPYLVFYRLRPGLIEVIGVRHGARDPNSMPALPR